MNTFCKLSALSALFLFSGPLASACTLAPGCNALPSLAVSAPSTPHPSLLAFSDPPELPPAPALSYGSFAAAAIRPAAPTEISSAPDGSTGLPNFNAAVILLYGSAFHPFAAPDAYVHCFDGTECGASDGLSIGGLKLTSLDTGAFTFLVDPARNTGGLSPLNVTASVATAMAAEPSSLILLGSGLICAPILYLRRRRII